MVEQPLEVLPVEDCGMLVVNTQTYWGNAPPVQNFVDIEVFDDLAAEE